MKRKFDDVRRWWVKGEKHGDTYTVIKNSKKFQYKRRNPGDASGSIIGSFPP